MILKGIEATRYFAKPDPSKMGLLIFGAGPKDQEAHLGWVRFGEIAGGFDALQDHRAGFTGWTAGWGLPRSSG